MFPKMFYVVLLILIIPFTTLTAFQVSESSIAELVQGLGNASFEIREKSQKELELIGEPTLAQLRKVLKSEDAEVRRRADGLVKKIESEVENKKLINPKKITMNHLETSVSDVIADLVKQTGYRIILQDKSGAAEVKKITVQVKDMPFWEALQLIEVKANLVEIVVAPSGKRSSIIEALPFRNLLPVGPGLAKPVNPLPERREIEEKKLAPKKGAGLSNEGVVRVMFSPQEKEQPPEVPKGIFPQVQIQILPIGPIGAILPGQIQAIGQLPAGQFPAIGQFPDGRGIPTKDNAIILKEGKVEVLPADTGSAYRIRMIKAPESLFGKPSDKQILVGLEVTPEPRIRLKEISSIKISKAIDDEGQVLELDASNTNNDPPAPPRPGRIIGRAVPEIGMEGSIGAIDAKVPIRFLKGNKASKTIQVLEGKLVLQVMNETGPVLEVKNLGKEVGKKIEGKSGAWIKLNEFEKDKNGSHRISFEFDIPSEIAGANEPLNNLQNPGRNVIILNGQVNFVFAGAAARNLSGFKILDEEGKALTPNSTSSSSSSGPTGITKREMKIGFPASSKSPASIIYDGSVIKAVDVPFVLRMLPLQ